MKEVNVLIFPAGAENAINIYDSLKYNLHFNVFGASSTMDHAEYLYPKDNYYVGDLYIDKPSFFNEFNNVLKKYNIDYIIPTHDTIALFMMKNANEINATIVCSPLETTEIAHSKKAIYDSLKGLDFIPKIYENIAEIEYPVFLKPDVGAGAKGTHFIINEDELNKVLDSNKNMVICENLPGDEYTVDCFTDRNRELLFAGPRTRQRITIGISFKSKSVELDEEMEAIAQQLNKKFVFRGAWFFQVKRDKSGKLKLLEFSVRQAGTMALYRQLGVNFATLSVFDFMDLDVKILYNKYDIELDRCLKNCYKINYDYDKIYIDFDDTLIIHDKVNTDIMKLIYQSINKNKKVILLTKHEFDLGESLNKYRISKTLFDEIILLKPGEKKSKYIDKNKSIFIDNYFVERIDVRSECDIPVFDVDSVESLIDYRQI